MRMLRRIKGVTFRDKVKNVDIRKEPGVSSIQYIVREMRLRWYGHMQIMEDNNEVKAVGDMTVPGKRPRDRPRWIWMDCVRRDMQALRIPQKMPRTQHSGNQEFGPLTPPSGKRRRRRRYANINKPTFYTHPICVIPVATAAAPVVAPCVTAAADVTTTPRTAAPVAVTAATIAITLPDTLGAVVLFRALTIVEMLLVTVAFFGTTATVKKQCWRTVLDYPIGASYNYDVFTLHVTECPSWMSQLSGIFMNASMLTM